MPKKDKVEDDLLMQDLLAESDDDVAEKPQMFSKAAARARNLEIKAEEQEKEEEEKKRERSRERDRKVASLDNLFVATYQWKEIKPTDRAGGQRLEYRNHNGKKFARLRQDTDTTAAEEITVFVATNEWLEVLPGQKLPGGLEFMTDATGRYARLPQITTEKKDITSKDIDLDAIKLGIVGFDHNKYGSHKKEEEAKADPKEYVPKLSAKEKEQATEKPKSAVARYLECHSFNNTKRGRLAAAGNDPMTGLPINKPASKTLPNGQVPYWEKKQDSGPARPSARPGASYAPARPPPYAARPPPPGYGHPPPPPPVAFHGAGRGKGATTPAWMGGR